MVDLDDEFLSDVAKQVAIDIRKTTTKLVRTFYKNPHLVLKIKSMGLEHKSAEMAGFTDAVDQMSELWNIKLTTPLEEELQMKSQIMHLKAETKELENLRNQKQEAFSKFKEEANEQKELRELEIQTLKKQIAEEDSEKRKTVKDINDAAKTTNEHLEKRHEETVAALKKTIVDLDAKLKYVRESNEKEESKLRADFNKAERGYDEKLKEYD